MVSKRSLSRFISLIFVISLIIVALSGSTLAEAVTWTSSGPYLTYVSALAVDPANPDVVYAGTSNMYGSGAGVFKSQDGGETWQQKGLEGTEVTGFAIDPSNSNIIYAVCGWAGVYKSTDGGSTWFAINSGLENHYGTKVTSIIINPTNPATLFIGVYRPFWESGGVYRSTNGGESWTWSYKPKSWIFAQALAIDPQNPNVVYASLGEGVWHIGMGVIKTIDGGNTWEQISATWGPMFTCLAVDPLNTMTLYAGFGNSFTGGGAIYKSVDGGVNWLLANTGFPNGWVNVIVVDPTMPSTLYVASGDYNSFGVYKSTDSAATWNPINAGLIDTNARSLVINPLVSSTLYVGTRVGGAFKTENSGLSWSPKSLGIESPRLFKPRIHKLVPHPTNPCVVYAVGNDGIFKTDSRGAAWRLESEGLLPRAAGISPSIELAIDPLNPYVLYRGVKKELSRSTDGGLTWTRIFIAPDAVRTITIDPTNSNVIYVGVARNGIFKSTDGGENWTAINTGLVDKDVQCLAIDHLNPNILYVGTKYDGYVGEGGVYKSNDGGESWMLRNKGIGLTIKDIWAIAIDPSDSNTLYIGLDYGVYKSTDAANSWRKVGSLSSKANSIAVSPNDSNLIYAGTGGGLFESKDAGANWALVSEITKNVLSTAFDCVGMTIYAGLDHYRLEAEMDGGVWQRTFDATPPTISITSPTAYGVYPAGPINFEFYATDEEGGSGVKSCSASLDGGAPFTSPQTLTLDAGVYNLIVTAQDNAGNIATKEIMFVVYDPTAGFVTGGGWIVPVTDSALPGYGEKATFGFVSKYLKGTTTPSGNLEFQYNYQDINLKSTSMQWLVVSDNSAIFQGTGTINGEGLYTYRADATDGDKTAGKPDHFKITIWQGNDIEADPIHKYEGDLAGGSIIVHKK